MTVVPVRAAACDHAEGAPSRTPARHHGTALTSSSAVGSALRKVAAPAARRRRAGRRSALGSRRATAAQTRSATADPMSRAPAGMTVRCEARACRASSASRAMRESSGAAVLGGTLVPPPVGRPRDWPSKAGSLRPVRAVVRVGVRSVSWTRPGRCVEVPMTSPSEVPRVLVVPAGRTAIWGPGSSSSAREATMKRVPGGACSWAVRKASSRALIRSASVETSRAVSTTVRSAPSARASGREGAKETDVLGELPGAPVASCALGPTA